MYFTMNAEDYKQTIVKGISAIDQLIIPLKRKYPQCYSADIGGYFVWRCEQIQKMFKTLLHIASTCDYVHSSNVILRALADHTSSLKLIYCNSDKEVVKLRHFLYVIDGCNERKKINESLINDDNINEDGIAHANLIIDKENNAKNYCENQIQSLNVYKNNPSAIEKLIKQGNWKFREVYKSSYSWKELYKEILDMPNDYINYLSQHVHGLAGGIGIDDDNPYYLVFGILLLIQNEFCHVITSVLFPEKK